MQNQQNTKSIFCSGFSDLTTSLSLGVPIPPALPISYLPISFHRICLMAHTQKRQPRFELPFLPTKERPQSALEKMEKIIYCTFTFSVSR